MKVITGKVIDGRVELPPGEVADGELVAVLAFDRPPAELSPEDEAELIDRFEAIARGEFVEEEDLLKQLRAQPVP
jgi:hypothetical protein